MSLEFEFTDEFMSLESVLTVIFRKPSSRR